jgi:hypothetical protein
MINWKSVIFWSIIIGAIGLTIIFREQIAGIFTGLGEQTGGLEIGGFNIGNAFNSAVEYLSANPLVAVGGIFGACTSGIALYKSLGKARVETALNELAIEKARSELASNTQLGEYSTQVINLKEQVTGLQAQINDDSLQQQIEAYKTQILQKDSDIKAKLETINTLQDTITELKMSEKIVVK